MKKLISVLMALIIILTLAACGAEKTPPQQNLITQLTDEGYEYTMTSVTEEFWKGLMEKDGQYLLVTAAMTPALYEDYNAIGFEDDYDALMLAFLGALKDVTSEDITDRVPSQEELDRYIGMTMGELEKEGYEQTGYLGDEGVYSFFYDGGSYSLLVDPVEGTLIEDMDDWSVNDLRGLEIGGVTFLGFSGSILD